MAFPFPVNSPRHPPYYPPVQFPGNQEIKWAFYHDDVFRPDVNPHLWGTSLFNDIAEVFRRKILQPNEVRPLVHNVLQKLLTARILKKDDCKFLEDRFIFCLLRIVGLEEIPGKKEKAAQSPRQPVPPPRQTIRDVREFNADEAPEVVSGRKREKSPGPVKGALRKPSEHYGKEIAYDLSKMKLPTDDPKEELTREQKKAKFLAEYNKLFEHDPEVMDKFNVFPRRKISSHRDDPGKNQISAFIRDDQVLEEHPMKILPNSPFLVRHDWRFLDNIIDDDELVEDSRECEKSRAHAIGVTEHGKHVVLLLDTRVSFETCVGMLMLDLGIQPDYRLMEEGTTYDFTRMDRLTANRPVKLISFNIARESALHGNGVEQGFEVLTDREYLKRLKLLIEQSGPVIVGHFGEGRFHFCIDKVTEDGKADVRLPSEGRMVTTSTDTLLSWIGNARLTQVVRTDAPPPSKGRKVRV